jgi:hypothetical protein
VSAVVRGYSAGPASAARPVVVCVTERADASAAAVVAKAACAGSRYWSAVARCPGHCGRSSRRRRRRELLDRFDDRLRLLTGGRPRAGGRHVTLAATIEWSYQLLSGTTSTQPNTLIEERGCDPRNELEQWEPLPVAPFHHMLKNKASGLCLDLQVNSEDEVVVGTLAQQFFCFEGLTSEHWLFPDVREKGFVQLVTKIRGLCGVIPNGELELADCLVADSSQAFKLFIPPAILKLPL